MKTVFKVGMEVYDNIFFPNSKGEVVRIDKHIDCERVIVQFDCLNYELSYTEKGRLTSTYNGATPTLSTKPYTLQGFEQKASAPTIEYALNWFNSDEFKNLSSPNKSSIDKIDEQLKALKELLVLRDYYNKGEVFDRVDFHGGGVYSIRLEDAGSPHFEIVKVCNAEYPFTFWDKDTAEKFMSEQSFLLSIAKPLL